MILLGITKDLGLDLVLQAKRAKTPINGAGVTVAGSAVLKLDLESQYTSLGSGPPTTAPCKTFGFGPFRLNHKSNPP